LNRRIEPHFKKPIATLSDKISIITLKCSLLLEPLLHPLYCQLPLEGNILLQPQYRVVHGSVRHCILCSSKFLLSCPVPFTSKTATGRNSSVKVECTHLNYRGSRMSSDAFLTIGLCQERPKGSCGSDPRTRRDG
jgi:hypothetical protein